MSLLKAVPGSNPAASGAGRDIKTGGSEAAMCGFTEISTAAEPAKSNAEVSTTDGKLGGAKQEGTSISAYKSQKADVGPESGS